LRSIPQRAWLLAALSGVLQALTFPFGPSISDAGYFLCWFAIVPLLLAILGPLARSGPQLVDEKGRPLGILSTGQGFWLGYLSGIIWYAGSTFWVFHVLHTYGAMHWMVSAIMFVLFCLYLALYHGLFGALVARAASGATGSKKAILLAPFLWVAVELARTRVTGFPWDLLGTAQVNNIPLTQVARLSGVYGISFGIMLVNTAFAAAFLLPAHKRRTMFLASVLAAGILQAGSLVNPPPLPTDHSARLVQQNFPIEMKWNVGLLTQSLKDLHTLSTSPAAKPDLIVWPESPAPFFLSEQRFRLEVTAIAVESHSYVIAGALGTTPPGKETEPAALQENAKRQDYNSAALITPEGKWAARYDKVHLVPFGEYIPAQSILVFLKGIAREVGEYGFVSGTQRTVFDAGGQRVGTFICYESIFPDEIREFAANGAQVLVNISNDTWFGDYGMPAQHLNMVRMRAIENQRWVLRSTNNGFTAAIDPYGRVTQSLPRKERAALDVTYALVSDTTFYTRHGDWFAWLCVIIAVLALFVRGRFRLGTIGRVAGRQ
jgi:apolipoprotein N-acyltransferase